MNGIDYLIGKIKRMICFVFGHISNLTTSANGFSMMMWDLD